MAQSNSAQREPSMEEILSSIRRIIEDGESGAKIPEVHGERGGAGSADANERPAAASDDSGAKAVHAAKPQSAPQKSLAEIQREIASEKTVSRSAQQPAALASASNGVQLKDSENEAAEASEGFSEKLRSLAPDSVDDEKEASASGTISAVVDSARESKGLDDDESVWADALKDDELEVIASQSAVKAEPASAPKPSASNPILSPDAGRRVAASFEQLSEAFMESRVKAFDTKAEEMLRPMLQEWLDENLPTLVERLVREEIERVARGGN